MNLIVYKNRLIISTLVYFGFCYLGEIITDGYVTLALIYYFIRVIVFYVIMFHYYKFYRIKYRGGM